MEMREDECPRGVDTSLSWASNSLCPKTDKLRADGVMEGVRLDWRRARPNFVPRISKAGEEKEPFSAREPEQAGVFGRLHRVRKTTTITCSLSRRRLESDVLGPQSITPRIISPRHIRPDSLSPPASARSNFVGSQYGNGFQAYQVFARKATGPFLKIAKDLRAPAIRIAIIESGKHYRYRISAIDQTGNPSEASPAVEVIAP